MISATNSLAKLVVGKESLRSVAIFSRLLTTTAATGSTPSTTANVNNNANAKKDKPQQPKQSAPIGGAAGQANKGSAAPNKPFVKRPVVPNSNNNINSNNSNSNNSNNSNISRANNTKPFNSQPKPQSADGKPNSNPNPKADGSKRPVSPIAGINNNNSSSSSSSSNNSNRNVNAASIPSGISGKPAPVAKAQAPTSQASTSSSPIASSLYTEIAPKAKTPAVSVQQIKQLRNMLIQKDVAGAVASLQAIASSAEGDVFDSGADMIYQPLLAIADALFIDPNNVVITLNAISKLGFSWEKHRTFILYSIGKFSTKDLDELNSFVDGISDLLEWDMLGPDHQQSLWTMIEAAVGPNPDILKLRVVLNMMSSLNAKWSNIPANYQQLIEAEIEALYQREANKEKADYGVKDMKEYKNVGLLVPSEFMIELIVTLADLDYKNASSILNGQNESSSSFSKKTGSVSDLDIDDFDSDETKEKK